MRMRLILLLVCALVLPTHVIYAQCDKAELVSGKPKDSKKVKDALQAFENAMREKEPERVEKLFALITDTRFLSTIDSEEDYTYKSCAKLRVTQVLCEVAKLPSKESNVLIVRLGKNEVFGKTYHRLQGLVIATRHVSQPSSELLAFLDDVFHPKCRFTREVVRSLVKISSKDACLLIEKRLLSKDYDFADKSGWLTDIVLTRRIDPNIVGMYGRLVRADISDEELRDIIIDSLFSYRGQYWYGTTNSFPEQPAWEKCETAVLKEILSIGELAPGFKVSENTLRGVRETSVQLRNILKKRGKKSESDKKS